MKLAQVSGKQKLENWKLIKFVECGNLNVGIYRVCGKWKLDKFG
jgi:hypothetical protein